MIAFAGKLLAFVSFISFPVSVIDKDKGEIFRKSLCCVSLSDSESEAEHSDRHNKKSAEQEEIEGNSSKKGKESYKKAREKVSFFILSMQTY